MAGGVAVRQTQGVGDEQIEAIEATYWKVFFDSLSPAVPPTLLTATGGEAALRVTGQRIFLFYT